MAVSWRRATGLGRALVLATGVSVLSAGTAPGPSFAALRAHDVIIIFRQPAIMPVQPVIEICADETQSIEITVAEHVLYRWGDDPPTKLREIYRPLTRSVKVAATISGTSATVSPTSVWVRPPKRTISLEIHGEDPGLTSVNLTAEGSLLVVLAIQVVECEFRVTLLAHWQLGMAFRPDLFASVSDLALKRARKDVYIGTGSLENAAAGEAVGGCSPSYKVDPSGLIAKLEIRQGQSGQQGLLNVSFNPVSAATRLNCSGYPAGTTNSATIGTIIDFQVPVWDPSRNQLPNHLLETQDYTALGSTTIFVRVVRP